MNFKPSSGELKKAFRIAIAVYTTVVQAMPQEITGQTQRPQSKQWHEQSEDLEL